MIKHFADLKIGERFLLNGEIHERIKPVYTKGTGKRRLLRGNFRNVENGILCRGNLGMVEVVANEQQ